MMQSSNRMSTQGMPGDTQLKWRKLRHQVKEMVGLGEIDESAEWINITYHDRRRSKVLPRGSLALSVSTFNVPKQSALII